MNMKIFDEQTERLAGSITEYTELYKYMKQITELMDSDGIDKGFVKKYRDISEDTIKKSKTNVFLSVILRTQGNRPTGLREAMLCLRAQSNQDFEIILIGHKAGKEGVDRIKTIIKEQPEEFRNRIKFIELNEGTRTTPINVGFANANGRYVAIFDDDDLLFDNWVEKFYEAERLNNGRILHAYTLAQKWKVFSTNEGKEQYYAAIDAPETQFCNRFDFLSQLVLNKCPLMSLAFPSYLFHSLGMYFNEELNVTEDWEYFMRVVTITGVTDIEEVTSIYRLWSNADTSAVVHNQSIWSGAYQQIQENMNQRQLLIPKGYVQHIISLIHRCNSDDMKMLSGYPKLQGLLYYENTFNFSDENMLVSNNQVYAPEIKMSFKLSAEKEKYHIFRFDPCEFGGILLSDLKIVMHTEEGGQLTVGMEECNYNGTKCEAGIYFLHYDPQISWCFQGEERITSIDITGNVNMEIREDIIQKAIKESGFMGKLKKKCKKVVKEIIGG